MSALDLSKVNTTRLSQLAIALAVLGGAFLLGRSPSLVYAVLPVAAMAAALLLRKPEAGMILLVGVSFTVPLQIATGTDVYLTIPMVLIPLLSVVWLLYFVGRRRHFELPPSSTYRPMFVFLAVGVLSLVAGRVMWNTQVPVTERFIYVQVAQLAIWVVCVLAYLLGAISGVRREWQVAALFLFFGLATEVMIESAFPPLQTIIGWSNPLLANRSMFWVWLCAMAGAQLLFNQKLSGLVKGWLCLLVGAAFFRLLGADREWISGWAPASIAMAVLLWFWVYWRSRRGVVIFSLLLVVLVFVSYSTLFQYAGGEEELNVSGGGRLMLYRAVLSTVEGHELLGLGPAAYRQYGFLRPLTAGVGTAFWVRPNLASHNNYIDIYAQTGVVGSLIFLWLLYELGLNVWRTIQLPLDRGFDQAYAYGALAGFVATLAAMLLADWFLPFVYNISFPGVRTSALAWLFLGGVVALQARTVAATGAKHAG